MYNSQYYTCEQIDQRLLQGYLDDYNTQTGQSLTKEQFLTKLGSVFAKETVIDNTAVNIGYFVCDTAAGTADKAVTAAGYELFHGGSIKVKFNNRNTAGSATLNINNKGAKALYYGGNPVSASNSWDNGEVVEIYYDGTNYYANNVEGNFKDGIFDISAYNLIEGQPTKYATLAEALGTNGNNIPYIFRKGGMQIKYVSTSDNKYIQARCMAQNFTTDITQWQGVDAEPTQGSDNLVKSGGVHAELKKIYDVFDSSEKGTFYISDGNGNVVAKIDENGLTDVNTEKTRNDILKALSLGEILRDEQDGFYITDKDGNVAFTISTTGEVNYNGKNNSSGTLKNNGNTPSDVVLNLMYGQSLSEGGFVNSGQYMSTLLQFDSVDDYKMLSCDETIMASETLLANYFGSDFLPSKTGITCTPIGFANLMFMQLLKNENGINIDFKEGDEPNYYFQLLGVNPTRSTGPNWVTIADPESLYYRRLLKAVEYGKKIAEANNKTFSVGSLCYMQGEHGSDSTHSANTRKEFHDKLWVLFSNLNHDIKEITGQDYDVLFLTYQLASQAASQYMDGHLDIPLAQLDIALETGGGEGYTLSSYPAQYLQDGVELIDRKYIQLGAIMNSLDYANNSDKIHATNNSYITAGAEFGIKLKRYIYDEAKLNIIYPISHKIIQRASDWLVVLDMNVPVAPLVFDTEHLECQSARANSANYGFSILNGATELITDVYLRRGKEVLLACSANPTGLSLTYAKDGWIVGGNLRDSQNIPFTVNGFNNVIHNWCPTFEITL